MRRSLRTLIALTLVAAMLLPAGAYAAKSGKRARRAQRQCIVPVVTYDSGGLPGTGAVNDPLFARQWGLDQIHAPAAWGRGATGAGATIAVLDTGVDLDHPDLAGHIVGGFDLQAGKRDCPPGPQDDNGHGTHVAGIAAAITNNGIGVAGTAPNAKIMPVRVLDTEGSAPIDTVVAGIRYAADHGAQVINLSLGELPIVGQSEFLNATLEEAVNYAWDRGALVVGAAGNESFPLCSYPAAAARSVCVGATDRRGLPTAYSNFPNNPHGLGSIGVRAPGGILGATCEFDEDVWSTMWPASSDFECGGSGFIFGYETLGGTSMAAPFVSGVAAILFGRGLTNQQVIDTLRTTSSNRGAYDPVYGYGIVDADAATQ